MGIVLYNRISIEKKSSKNEEHMKSMLGALKNGIATVPGITDFFKGDVDSKEM